MLNNPVIWIGMEREWEIGTQARGCAGSSLAGAPPAAPMLSAAAGGAVHDVVEDVHSINVCCGPGQGILGWLPDPSCRAAAARPALQLRAALEEQPGKLPGFMRMCDCLVRTDDLGSGRARFSGMIMEKLNGEFVLVFFLFISRIIQCVFLQTHMTDAPASCPGAQPSCCCSLWCLLPAALGSPRWRACVSHPRAIVSACEQLQIAASIVGPLRLLLAAPAALRASPGHDRQPSPVPAGWEVYKRIDTPEARAAWQAVHVPNRSHAFCSSKVCFVVAKRDKVVSGA